jgi:tRNA1Val (adenine37-N6)-methyltransferase
MKVCTDSCLFGAWMPLKNEGRFLDIGTGTGLLALMAAQRSNALVDAIELQYEAAVEASENVKSSPWSDRIHVFQGNILDSHQPVLQNRYDVIFCNPPFYENHMLPPENNYANAHHQETLPLNDLLKAISILLKNDGIASLLLPAYYHRTIGQLLKKVDLHLARITAVKNMATGKPIRIMISAVKTKNDALENEIVIYNDDKTYTKAFVDLLKPFYLYL